jgi:hypothetical protein
VNEPAEDHLRCRRYFSQRSPVLKAPCGDGAIFWIVKLVVPLQDVNASQASDFIVFTFLGVRSYLCPS